MVAATSVPWSELAPERRADFSIDGLQPRYHLRPETPEALADALRLANEEGLAVSPRGGGTHVGLGNPPSRFDLVVETTGLDRVIEYEPADLTVTVEAGLRFQALQDLLREHGQLLALDPPATPETTIGGVVAANVSGPLRFAHGTARDLVIGARVANPDGRLTRSGGRVVKNVAGYDLNKLHTGALGTLGVIVELSFKLAPIPPSEATVVGSFGRSGGEREFLTRTLHSPLSPRAIELLGSSAAAALGLGDGPALVLRVGGYQAAVERQVRDLQALVRETGGSVVDAPQDLWEDLARLSLAAERPALVRAAAPISRAADLVALLEQRLGAFQPVVWARAGNGVAYAALGAVPEPLREIHEALQQARQAVAAFGDNSSLVVERLPAAAKADFDVWGDPGAGVGLMRALKQQLDPRSTLNPGRFVGGI